MVEVLVVARATKRWQVMSAQKKYKCPYCEREALSPGGVKFHVRSEHPDKVGEFQTDHYLAMEEEFNK